MLQNHEILFGDVRFNVGSRTTPASLPRPVKKFDRLSARSALHDTYFLAVWPPTAACAGIVAPEDSPKNSRQKNFSVSNFSVKI
ncbi:MAG TPA: hypothetical protein VGX78_12090 [Pirellulales bacterium]|jgi:hypothetical protein|nr:hypothetical protein [Pirellulales bacterium]